MDNARCYFNRIIVRFAKQTVAIRPSQGWELHHFKKNLSNMSFPLDRVRQGICPSQLWELHRITKKSPNLLRTDCPDKPGNDKTKVFALA